MKTIKSVALVMLLGLSISILMSSCKEKEVEVEVEVPVTEICGCMDATAVNYNPDANCDDQSCILPSQLDDTTRTFWGEHDFLTDPANTPYHDKHHASVTWNTDYKDLGFSTLTGRFGMFDGRITFNEADPSLTVMDGWVQLSTQGTTEPGRDNPGNCGPRYHEVDWYTHDIYEYDTIAPDTILIDTITVYDSSVVATDYATIDVSGGEFFFLSNKRGFTTSYKSTGTLTYLGESSTVDVYFDYNGIDYESGRTGFDGYFEFNCISDHGQTSSSAADLVLVEFHMPMRGL